MKSTVENLGPTRVRLAIEVPFDELKPSLDAAYKKIGAQIKIPGFRPGKAPARIIDQRVGRGAVLEEAVNNALPRAYSEAVRESGVKALGQPDIELTKLADGESIAFTAEVDVRPEIELPELTGLEVTVDDVEITEEEVEEQFDALRDRFATLTGVDREVRRGDFVSVDLAAAVDGVEVEGGSATGLSYEVGAEDLVDGLDDAVVGLSAGGSATFASLLRQGEHAGREADITVVVNSVKEKERPVADDEFAQLASEFDTLEELREDLRTRLGRVKALEQGSQARDKVLEKLLDSIDIPLPESAVKAEVDSREHDVIHSLGHDDAMLEQYLATQSKTREEFTADLRESAERSVKAQFVLDAVADAEQVTVGDTELTEFLIRQAARYEMSPKELADQIVEAGNLPALVADVRRNKALATLLESARISDASGNPVDLSTLRPAESDDAADADEPATATDAEPDRSEELDEDAGV